MEHTPLTDGLITAATSLSGVNILRREIRPRIADLLGWLVAGSAEAQ